MLCLLIIRMVTIKVMLGQQEGWQEINCYLKETASGYSFFFNSGTSTLQIQFQLDSNSPIMHLWFWQILQIK